MTKSSFFCVSQQKKESLEKKTAKKNCYFETCKPANHVPHTVSLKEKVFNQLVSSYLVTRNSYFTVSHSIKFNYRLMDKALLLVTKIFKFLQF